MATFSQRHNGYKGGVALFVVGMALFITGFATPNWCDYSFEAGVPGSPTKDFVLEGHAGLWVTCFKGYFGESHCVESTESSGWMLGVKGMQCAGLVIMALSLFFAVHVNFLAKNPTSVKLLEIGIGLAGGLGLGGAVTYAVRIESDEDFVDNVEGNHDYDVNVSWSFGVNIAGCALLLLSTVLISIFNRPLAPQPSTTTFSNLNGTAVAAPPAPGTVHVYATPGSMAGQPQVMYSAPPPAYYSNALAQGPGQGQASGPMVFDSPVQEGMKQ